VGLDRLTVIVVDNSSSSYGWSGGAETRFSREGWSAARVSGRDHAALAAALSAPHPGRPHAVVAVIQPESEGKRAKSMDTMRGRFEQVTSQLLDTNSRLAVVTADIGADAFAPARQRHPGRVINLGIREQLLIGVTSGLALTGMRPVAHTFAPFLVE